MRHNNTLIAVVLLVSLLLLLNPSVSSPAIYAQNSTPTRVASQYAEITADNARYLAPWMTIGNGYAYLPRWSPDGKQLAVGGSKGVWLMDATNFEQPPQLMPGTPANVHDLAYSPDDSLLAVAGDTQSPADDGANGILKVWDLARHEPLIGFRLLLSPVKLTFSPDGKYFVYVEALPYSQISFSVTTSCVIHIFDLSNSVPQQVRTLNCARAFSDSHLIFSPDSKWLVFGTQLSDMQFVNMQTGNVTLSTWDAESPANLIDTMRFSPKGDMLIINLRYPSSGGTPYLIDLATMQRQNAWYDTKTGNAHLLPTKLILSDDGQKVYAIVDQPLISTFKIWDAVTGQLLATVDLPYIYGLDQQNPQNHTVILKRTDTLAESTLPEHPNYLVMDDQTGNILFSFNGLGAWLSLSPDGKLLAVANNFGVDVLNATTGQKEKLPVFWIGQIGDFKIHPDGKIISVSTTTGVRFWDILEHTPIYFTEAFRQAALSPDGKWLAAQQGYSPIVEFYDFQSRQLLRTITLPESLEHLTFSRDSQSVLAVIHESYPIETSYLTRISVQSGELIKLPALSFSMSNNGLTSVSDDGRLVVLYSPTDAVIWDLETNTTVILNAVGRTPFVDWTFSVDHSMVAAIERVDGSDGFGPLPASHHLAVWDTSTGNLIQSLQIPVAYLVSTFDPIHFANLSFSPLGNRIYALSADTILGQPAAWELTTGQQVMNIPLQAHSSIASPTQDILAVAVLDRVYVMSIASPRLLWAWENSMKNVKFSPDGRWLVGRNLDELTLFALNPPSAAPIASR